MSGDRIHKALAEIGCFGSRRNIENRIISGNITINGVVPTIGSSIYSGDVILINGKRFVYQKLKNIQSRVIIYNKSSGQICSSKDNFGRVSVFNFLPKINIGRWIMVGRLDFNTIGLLLFTNNGNIAYRLMHPSYKIPREYIVYSSGRINNFYLKMICHRGVNIGNTILKFKSIIFLKYGWNYHRILNCDHNHYFCYRIVLCEGKNREIRKVFKYLNLKIIKLVRISYGIVRLPQNLAFCNHQELSLNVVNLIKLSIHAK